MDQAVIPFAVWTCVTDNMSAVLIKPLVWSEQAKHSPFGAKAGVLGAVVEEVLVCLVHDQPRVVPVDVRRWMVRFMTPV